MTAPDYQSGEDIDLDPWRITGSPIQTYTPEWLGTTGDPVLGTGSVQEGWWTQANELIVFWGRLRFGTSGVSAGTGFYRVTGPVAAPLVGLSSGTIGAGVPVGRGVLRDNSNSNPNSRAITLQMASTAGGPSGEATFMLLVLDGTTTQASNTAPFTWNLEDGISFHGIYPAG